MRSPLLLCWLGYFLAMGRNSYGQTIVNIVSAIKENQLSDEWLTATSVRIDKNQHDSIASIRRNYSIAENNWMKLLQSKKDTWAKFPDSLQMPFGKLRIPDTIRVLVGHSWVDDCFTFGINTICFDLTALQANYGDAGLPENFTRIDRLFAHECTHLFSKKWMKEAGIHPRNFRDSVLWECWYEGLGMYRSLTNKWLPVNGKIPDASQEALRILLPILKANLQLVQEKKNLSQHKKESIQKNLSKGPVHKKWGALSIAIFLALEANGDDSTLQWFVHDGPEAVLTLIHKYLSKE